MHTTQGRRRGGGGNESSSGSDDDGDDDEESSSDSDISMEDGQYFEAKQGEDTGEKQEQRVLWLIKSGEEAKLEGMDLTRPLYVRVGFAPVDDYQNVRCWYPPFLFFFQFPLFFFSDHTSLLLFSLNFPGRAVG